MPCHELFDQQSEGYKNKILAETELVVSIEASETRLLEKIYWQRRIKFWNKWFWKKCSI